ncbi:hypothetical protein ACS0TY_024094 [Phlomoides rotata]
MTHQECPGVGRGSMKKACNNTRRIWTTHEEKVLINVLKELVNKGYKTDNGFRTGYLIKCGDALKTDFPKTDLQATPYITSKLIAWKKYYSTIVTAHLVTGFGFNTTTSQVECTDEQWDDVLRRDPNMRGMRYKEWPYFPDWVEIFGLNRVTGLVTEDVVEMAKCLKQIYYKPPLVVGSSEHDGANYHTGGDQQPQMDGIGSMVPNDPYEENGTTNAKNNVPRAKVGGSKKNAN